MHDIFIQLTRAFLEKVAKASDEHTTEKSYITEESDGLKLVTPDYLQYAVYGRGPGKAPPISAMMDFVKAKGIIFDNMDQRGTAFAIAASIAKKGTSNWVPNAPNVLEEFIQENISEYYTELNIQLLDKENKDISEIFSRTIPTQIKFKI
jgi:uncharacterized protein YciU (UPF0263 family)